MYPAVTALPCQGPLGKRALGTGEADCHDQFANWSRNDTFLRSAVQHRRADRGVRPYKNADDLARAGGVEPRPYGG